MSSPCRPTPRTGEAADARWHRRCPLRTTPGNGDGSCCRRRIPWGFDSTGSRCAACRQPRPTPGWLLDFLTRAEPPPEPVETPSHGAEAVESKQTCKQGDDSADFWLGKALERASGGNRNETGVWLACQLRDAGVSETETRATVLGYARRVRHLGDHPYTDEEALASVEQAYKRPRRETAESQTSKLPVVPTRGVAPGDSTNGAPSSSGVVNLADLRRFFGAVQWAWEPYRVEGVGERAVAFLRMALADGGRSRAELIELAEQEGISRATLDRAKEAAGVVSVDGKWTLSQPCGA